MKISRKELWARVDKLKEIARSGNDEGAHIEEDRIREDVLRTIADGAPQPASLARIALTTADIEFNRRSG